MPNKSSDIYSELLKSFNDTLTDVSYDIENNCSMITNNLRVINVDKLKDDIAATFKLSESPQSCDTLYKYEDEYFLIEFKNGKLENSRKSPFEPIASQFYDIIRKIFESLLLLNEKLKCSISDTRKNFIFILVFNEDKNSYLEMKDKTIKLGYKNKSLPLSPLSEILPDNFNIKYFDKLYFKGVYICSKTTFENIFIKKYSK
jgi:hypothetical protein